MQYNQRNNILLTCCLLVLIILAVKNDNNQRIEEQYTSLTSIANGIVPATIDLKEKEHHPNDNNCLFTENSNRIVTKLEVCF